MIRWNISAHQYERAGIENPFQLAKKSGIGYPAAVTVMDPAARLEKVQISTLEAVARALNVKRPLTLLAWEPDAGAR